MILKLQVYITRFYIYIYIPIWRSVKCINLFETINSHEMQTYLKILIDYSSINIKTAYNNWIIIIYYLKNYKYIVYFLLNPDSYELLELFINKIFLKSLQNNNQRPSPKIFYYCNLYNTSYTYTQYFCTYWSNSVTL